MCPCLIYKKKSKVLDNGLEEEEVLGLRRVSLRGIIDHSHWLHHTPSSTQE